MPRLLLPGAGELLRRLLLVVRRTLAGLLLRGLLLAALLEVHLRFSALNEFDDRIGGFEADAGLLLPYIQLRLRLLKLDLSLLTAFFGLLDPHVDLRLTLLDLNLRLGLGSGLVNPHSQPRVRTR